MIGPDLAFLAKCPACWQRRSERPFVQAAHLAAGNSPPLFRRTTSPDAHPHEALLGILALLHGASGSEVRHLRVSHIDAGSRTVRLGKRPHPVPLDPASWQVLQRCLAHRSGQHTANPHVIVTKGTKAGGHPHPRLI